MIKRKTLINLSASLLSAALLCGCGSSSTGSGTQPLVISADGQVGRVGQLSFRGAFALPLAEDNVSSLGYATGVIEARGDSLFIAGHTQDDAVAEFTIPELVPSTDRSDLFTATLQQGFVKVLDRALSGNPERLDEITGLELVGNRLLINAVEYYDGPADNRLSTLVIDNGFNLRGSAVSAFRQMQGRARAAGWISSIPDSNRQQVGGSHIFGSSSGGPIIARYSVGPSAFVVNLDSLSVADQYSIPGTEILGFSLDQPLSYDLNNDARSNELWTHLSQAKYGFILPGTSTYMTIGYSGGHRSGVGYKITQNNGNECGGFCSYDVRDNYNYYWLWNLDEMMAVRNGAAIPSQIRPYEFGRLNLPFQSSGILRRVAGASFDPSRNLLYISLQRVENSANRTGEPPIIVAYGFDP